MTHGELEDGLNAVAVGVFDHLGAVVASISVSGPALRFDPQAPTVVTATRAAGLEVSRRMGYAGR